MTELKTEGLTTFELIEIFAKLIGDPNHKTALMLWGLTGTGKSQIQRQVLKRICTQKSWQPGVGEHVTGALELIGDWGLIDLRVSLLEPTDLRGLPDLSGKTTRWIPPDELPLIGSESRFPERGILFLDELTHAQPTMQSACFSLVLDRRCGPHVLLPGWKIVAASNYSTENSYTYQMSEPLRGRFENYHLRCSLEAFKRWGIEHNIDQRILAFLNWNPDYLHKPGASSEHGFPTPRSWTNASYSLHNFKNGHLKEVLASNIGPGAAGMFHGFIQVFNSPEMSVNIPNMLNGKEESPKMTLQKPAVAWAFAASIAGHVKENPKLLVPAIKYFCHEVWADALEIGRTGLSDLKYIVGKEAFIVAYAPFVGDVQKRYGQVL